MLRTYLKIALRNVLRHKGYSFLNITGLSTGMAVALLIGLWVYDEVSFDKHFPNYPRIAQVLQHRDFAGGRETWRDVPVPTAEALRQSYGNYFERVVQSSWNNEHVLTAGDNQTRTKGTYLEPEGPELLSLQMLRGIRAGLRETNSMMLSETLARTLFGKADPVGKIIRINNQFPVVVTGVYADLPHNSSFGDMAFVAPWELYLVMNKWIKEMTNPWGVSSSRVLVQVAPNQTFEGVSAKIRDLYVRKLAQANDQVGANQKPQLFLFPMSRWYLQGRFEAGVNRGGQIEFVWLFSTIGVFVLLLACINFMNLSTARSEKRAKEVGIRKTMGSLRKQLVAQFLGESVLFAVLAFGVSLLLVGLLLPWFNQVAGKKIALPWTLPAFWLLSLGFVGITGLLAGSYPALYLSSFQAVKVLKGTFRTGRFAALPRKALVVLQFTVSVALITGTLIVYRQIQFAKNRPVGYSRSGLVSVRLRTPEVIKRQEVLVEDLLATGAVARVASSGSPVTDVWITNSGFNWKGKPAGMQDEFATVPVTYEYGKTVGWQLAQGRDFSGRLASDSAAFILNEAAIKYMGLANPVGEVVRWGPQLYTVIGVVKDMVMQSPYAPVKPTIYVISRSPGIFLIARINPSVGASEALTRMGAVFRKHDPATPFEYQFADEDYARKFGNEERISKLATFFAVFAIFISCLGLYGLAAFVSERRTKEIGIRKVLGASVLNLWGLLSKEFFGLVILSCLIAAPIANYFLSGWLEQYEYRTAISAWIFGAAGLGALLITLLTVSYHAIRAALANPVKSLRTE